MPVVMKTIFVLVALFLIAISVWLRHMNRKAASWPSVEGEIITSELVEDNDGDTSLHIVYLYSVTGRSFTSDQFSFTVMSNSESAKMSRLSQYPVGRNVSVYYDPENPRTSVIYREESQAWIATAAVGGVFATIGILM
jgi:hypothetical protein